MSSATGRFLAANVMEPEPVQAAVDAAAGAEGGLRISVCCAGIGWAQRTAGKQPHDLEIFHNVIKVNLIGTFNVLRLAAQAMVDNEPDAEAANAASASTRPRSRPTTARSARSPTPPRKAASSA